MDDDEELFPDGWVPGEEPDDEENWFSYSWEPEKESDDEPGEEDNLFLEILDEEASEFTREMSERIQKWISDRMADKPTDNPDYPKPIVIYQENGEGKMEIGNLSFGNKTLAWESFPVLWSEEMSYDLVQDFQKDESRQELSHVVQDKPRYSVRVNGSLPGWTVPMGTVVQVSYLPGWVGLDDGSYCSKADILALFEELGRNVVEEKLYSLYCVTQGPHIGAVLPVDMCEIIDDRVYRKRMPKD
jgi:hypothetical protein